MSSVTFQGLSGSRADVPRVLVGGDTELFRAKAQRDRLVATERTRDRSELQRSHRREMDTIQLLFDDVGRTPIIASAAQELWLGIQIRAPKVWSDRIPHTYPELPSAIFANLTLGLNEMEQQCRDHGVSPLRIETMATEALQARKSIYTLGRSRLRRFVQQTGTLGDEEAKDLIVTQTYNIAELLSLLPNFAIRYIASSADCSARLPTCDDFDKWLGQQASAFDGKQSEERALEAQRILVDGYLRYVLRIARSFLGRGVEYLDLVQEGTLGLMRAAERYDYREGVRFATFASNWIWQAIGRALADQSRLIRLPVHMYEQVQTLQRMLEADSQEDDLVELVMKYLASSPQNTDNATASGRGVTPESSRTTKTRRRANRILEYLQSPVPLEISLPQDLLDEIGLEDVEGATLAHCVADQHTRSTPELRELRAIVQKSLTAMDNVSKRDLEVVRMRYGLDDGQDRTLEEVGHHFGLTRERIRQIEKKVLQDLERNLPPVYRVSRNAEFSPQPLLLRSVKCYLDEQYDPGLLLPQNKSDRVGRRLDRYLANLPGNEWHKQRANGEHSRCQQLETSLRLLAGPAHYTAITEQMNDLLGDVRLDAANVYNLLKKHEDVCIPLGDGVFSLVEWERNRASEADPVLPFCPPPLPDPPNQPNAFLESVMQTCAMLQTSCSAETLLCGLVQWAGLSWPQPLWVCQSALSTYYLVGVVPFVFYGERKDDLVHLALPVTDLRSSRQYCLETLSRRLQAMPEFWWLLQRFQPIRVTDLAQLFVDVHPLALDDVANRLTILTGIGAVHRSSSGRYHLTRLGETTAKRWARQPEAAFTALPTAPVDEISDFAELVLD